MTRSDITLVTIDGKAPRIHSSAFVAPGCRLIGDIEIGPDISIWYNCVIRADVNRIVSLRAENDITARGILESWANMFDLKMLEDEDRVMLLPRVEYLKKLRAEAEEAKLANEIRASKADEQPRVRRASPVGAP